jgi:hypothetical protein
VLRFLFIYNLNLVENFTKLYVYLSSLSTEYLGEGNVDRMSGRRRGFNPRPIYVGFVVKKVNVGPCHLGMARPQVADRGTASYMEVNCE